MNDCVNGEIRDALPEFLHGRLSDIDAATVAEHVESCADCRAELAVLRDVRTNAAMAPAIDAVRVAAAIRPYAVVPGASAPSAPRPVFARTGAWRLAAVAALVAIGGWAVAGPGRESSTSAEPAAPVQVTSLSLTGGVQDLSDAQLEQLLADLDGIEAIPSAEPSPVTLPVDDAGATQ